MNIQDATKSYEAWLERFTPLVKDDLNFKHQQMNDALFPFMRATFYRWMQIWPVVCKELEAGPRVLGVGDLHVENFGTWRDSQGRLVWGINDFDEAEQIPYAMDLVRLASSARLVSQTGRLRLSPGEACEAILEGYLRGLESGGEPLVLEERHPTLRALAMQELRDPTKFWAKMQELKGPATLPKGADAMVKKMLPAGVNFRVVRRRAGLGSLGKTRVVAIAEWNGALIAREAKALAPSAAVWARGKSGGAPQYQKILRVAIRCPDPLFEVGEAWIVRRLAPDCSRIELDGLEKSGDQIKLLHAMGFETANVHLGSGAAIKRVSADLRKRKIGWLAAAAERMVSAIESDWADWRRGR